MYADLGVALTISAKAHMALVLMAASGFAVSRSLIVRRVSHCFCCVVLLCHCSLFSCDFLLILSDCLVEKCVRLLLSSVSRCAPV